MAFFQKRHFRRHMHAFLHKSRRENHRWVVFTQQDTIYSCTHLVLTNFLTTSLLVLSFSQWFLLFLPPKFLLMSCHPIDSYSDICYLGIDELIIFVSFLWMIWVDLPFLIYLSIYSNSDIFYVGTDEFIIFISILWMAWVDFLLNISIHLSVYLSIF